MLASGGVESLSGPSAPRNRIWERVAASDTGILVLLSLALVILHTLTNGR
jgi:hypothetical protein